ncbi:MAG TPA: tRNA (adenosine(37)-N6)-threonylcarbamoyltransferase complex transferase subunit TsaD [Candidatus Kapabacteria bacterium]|nr:tRNA (adenosine(37)-N6)-threonylcarbamoyltransferase complex transferase subunit TsaD [Candidatus Kapabacteria bacterium]
MSDLTPDPHFILGEGTILGIESSCDETSAAILRNGELASVVVSSQFFHQKFGGVVPELASRAHVKSILPIVREAMLQAAIEISDITSVAVTYAPGLMGSLLVGLNFAKGLALGLSIPLIGVHHIEAHIFSSLLEEEKPSLPFIALVVSGGHTLLLCVRDVGSYELLGVTLDDAAGEAFDKVGKMLGLEYPAGPEIDKLAKSGNPDFVRFPRAMINEANYDFSFSGIKTSVLYWLKRHGEISDEVKHDIAASFQRAMVDVLVTKAIRAAEERGISDIVCVGGVSANSELRERFRTECGNRSMRFFTPRPLFSTDNAAMIAMLGAMKLERGQTSDFSLTALPRVPLAHRI